jgi:hypothetical protein
MVVFSVGCAALFIAVPIVAYRTRGASWVTIVLLALATFAAAGVLDVPVVANMTRRALSRSSA